MWYALCVQHVCIKSARCLSLSSATRTQSTTTSTATSMLTVKCSVIKLQNFGEGIGDRYALRVHRWWIARCFARFACEGLKHCADFAHQRKSVQSVHARFLQTCTLGPSEQSAPDAFRKSMHQVCSKCAEYHGFCIKSAYQPVDFLGKSTGW
jgi:hypothetical protein